MKITNIEPVIVHVNHRGDWVFLHVHTDEGIIGLGEASHSSNDSLLVATVEVLKPQLIGADPMQIEAIWHRLAGFKGGRIGHTAISAIEQALWDIMGQKLGVPIHALLGGAMRDRIRLYANINRHVEDRSPAGFAQAARQAADEGFTAIKLAPFDEVRGPTHIHTGSNATWRTGVERVAAVREAIGEEVELAVDCHSRFDPSEAIAVGRAMADLNLFWFEEPVHYQHADELAYITKTVPMPTASAESVFGIEAFQPFLTRRIVDVIMPDVKHAGGLLETKKIAAAARMNKVLVAPHNPSGPVASVASVHVCATLSNFYILEYAWGEVDWRADLLTPAEPIESGHALISNAPGLGYQLNPDMLTKYRIDAPSTADSSKALPTS